MLLPELPGAPVAERGVQPLGVVDRVDDARKVSRDIGEGFVLRHLHGFDLERFHEAHGRARFERAAHGIAEGLARPRIEHLGPIAKAARDGDVGEIGNPELVGTV